MTSIASPAGPGGPSWPVVVSGSGGSGTRLLVALLRGAGVFMGTDLNPSDDARAFRSFEQEWLLAYLHRLRGETAGLDRARMAGDFRQALARHCADLPDPSRPWGWKRIESLYLLPFLHQQLPGLAFLHMVRNGLDMAFSANQAQLDTYGGVLLGHAYDHEPPPLRSLRLWIRVNSAAAEYGQSRMASRYLLIQYETLCARPVETIASILTFLGLPGDPAAFASLVTTPGGIGRWRAQPDARLLLRMLRLGQPALQRFAYWDQSAYQQLSARLGRRQRAWMYLEDWSGHTRQFLLRATRALRERRLQAALRNCWGRWRQKPDPAADHWWG